MAYSWCIFGFAAASVLPGISEDHRPISIGKEIRDIWKFKQFHDQIPLLIP